MTTTPVPDGTLPFPEVEFAGRLDRLREQMAGRGLDAMVVVRPENIFYVSGYRAAHVAQRTSELHVVVVPRDRDPRIFVRALEGETVRTQWTPSPHLYQDHEDPYPAVAEALAEFGAVDGVIGLEYRFLRHVQYLRLRGALPAAELVDASGLVETVAARPSDAERDCMRRAAVVTEVGLRTGIESAAEGRHAYDIVARVHEAMYSAGQSDADKSLVAVWSGPRGGLMHDTSVTRRLEPDDLVTVEIMGVHNHYRAGAQACVPVGRTVSSNVRRAYALVGEMHDAARASVRAGVAAGDVFDAANAVFRRDRGDDYHRRVGGSMGLTTFTLDLVKGNRAQLQPGMPLLVQTLVDDPALLTRATTVIVTEDGCEPLTHSDVEWPPG